MKKTILLLLAVALTQAAFGQINSGAVLIEGSVSFDGGTTNDEFSLNNTIVYTERENTYFSFRPRAGVFVGGSVLVGLGFTYEFSGYNYSYTFFGNPGSTYAEKTSLYLVNPYIRKYVKLKEDLFFTVTGDVSWGLGKTTYGKDDPESDTDLRSFRIGVTPGITYFVSRQWAVSATFGQLFYNYQKETLMPEIPGDAELDNIDKTYGVSLQFNTFGIGVQYFLGNKGAE